MNLQELANNAADKVEVHYVPLDDLVGAFLTGNSKKHDTSKIVESIQKYGFKDPITFDPSLNGGKGGIVEGNGRLESLIAIKDSGETLPRGIKEGWTVPVIFGVNSASESEAIAYSIEHNWSVSWGSDIDTGDLMTMFDSEALTEQIEAIGNDIPLSFGEDVSQILTALTEEPLPEDNQEIDEEKLKKYNHKCPECGHRW